jgi:hypothetical protein
LSRVLKSLAAVLVLAGVLPVVGGAAPSHVQTNSTTYEDSTGDDPGGPDIQTVVASNDNTGLISFQINVPNQASLTGVQLTDIDIDADNNPSTGDTDPLDLGADYAIELFQGQATLFKWDGTTFSRNASGPPESTLIFSNGTNGPTIKINASELGNPKKINFNVTSISGATLDSAGNLDFTNAHADFAPDLGHGFYAYDVKTAKLKLVAKSFRTSPSAPHAGGSFTAQLVAQRNDTGATIQSGAVKCAARAGGTPIGARVHRISGKVARCTWLIPSSARGKTLHGTITVSFEGLKVSRSFSLPIH